MSPNSPETDPRRAARASLTPSQEQIQPAAPDKAPASFDEFWLRYLQAHSRPATRAVHYVAIVVAVAAGIFGLVTVNAWLVVAAVFIGYVPAVLSHRLIEDNKPLIPENPFWAAACGVRMLVLGLTFRLGRELRRAGLK